MAYEAISAAFFALGHAIKKKKESPIEPFRRTLDLANAEYDRAVNNLLDATEELARLAPKAEKKDASN